MPQFNAVSPTTELDAVNEILAAVGEAAIDQAQLDNPTLPKVEMAVAIFKSTLRAVLGRGWRFNTEYGYEIAPTDDSPYTWTGTDGESEQLNIFEPPSDLLSWELTDTDDLVHKDLVLRPPRNYSGTATTVFYDREKNRDGLPADDFDFIYIDPVWSWDFEDTPQSFRTYVAIRAARHFQAKVVGDEKVEAFTRNELREALRDLRKDQGQKEDVNLFDNHASYRHLGSSRRPGRSRFIDRRDSPGHS